MRSLLKQDYEMREGFIESYRAQYGEFDYAKWENVYPGQVSIIEETQSTED